QRCAPASSAPAACCAKASPARSMWRSATSSASMAPVATVSLPGCWSGDAPKGWPATRRRRDVRANTVHDPYAGTRFDGRVAIITGGGSRGEGIGNGRASAMLLALRGARVLVADLRIEAARDTVQRILDAGG